MLIVIVFLREVTETKIMLAKMPVKEKDFTSRGLFWSYLFADFFA